MPVHIGYAAMLERFPPAEAVALAALAESHGFTGVMASDHFQPWLPAQGQSSFVWSVLAALGERTTGDLGPGVTTPTFRWHPAMVAQASATLGALYPGRHWLGIGSGEALNEHIVGHYWPEAPERINRMFEAVDVIKKLFAGSLAGRDVRHSGQYFKLESTRLWTMPAVAPQIFVAASGPVTARRAGRNVDGLITTGAPAERLAALLTRFAEGAREGGRDPSKMPKVLQLHLSWAATDEEAMRNALVEWPNGGMRFARSDIRSPFEFEQLARTVRAEDFKGQMVISADPDVHRADIQRHLDLGFDRVYLHNVGRNQAEFLEVFGREVLPALRA
ncbi:TIGR03557 family F420-dependent LLM class oxidoreductase [Agromyces albus]|uniref:TIGR03557 family F420-dependent LLM class oxidoreductase n=1 Tax=Agromyces albus TaxID=205332 RepID=A0A4Q2L6B7_9MICO|nr:TIGR03557 family F420-dependent LLM class oxidoreductase [Agromyces albus]RXZ71761.1 TIGR03557 family F420-dependent LLM class oxidoreductase [Agromyces albus]